VDILDLVIMNQSKHFSKDRDPQRFYYKDNFPIDIVPFGKISKPDDIISWPDGDGVVMNTLGFEEAYGDSVPILLRQAPELIIKIASLRGLAAMKLISWKDLGFDFVGNTEALIFSINKMNSFEIQLPDTMEIVPGSCDKAVKIGASKVSQLEENVKALANCKFSKIELDAIDKAII